MIKSSCFLIKLFRSYQKNNDEIIDFSSFIMIICCIAHIGLILTYFVCNYYHQKDSVLQNIWKIIKDFIKKFINLSSI